MKTMSSENTEGTYTQTNLSEKIFNFDQSQHFRIAVLISMFGPSAHIYDLTCCEVDSCNFLQMFSRPPYCRMKLRFLNKTTKKNG